MPTLQKSSKSIEQLSREGKVRKYTDYSIDDIIEVARCKNIPADVPDTTLISVPTSICTYDLEASGLELVGGLTNRKLGYSPYGRVFLNKHISIESLGRPTWWRLFVQKRGSTAV